MKLTFATAVIIVFCMLLLPLISVSGDTDQKKKSAPRKILYHTTKKILRKSLKILRC